MLRDDSWRGENIDWGPLYHHSIPDKLQSYWGKQVCDAFSRFISPRSKVLEIGCGSGRILAHLVHSLNVEATGIDSDSRAVDFARKLTHAIGAECRLLRASGFAIPFPDSSFDAVYSEGVIEHFSPIDTLALIKEHVRVCRRGGRVIIAVPNLFNLPLTYYKLRTGRNYHFYPERSFTLFSLSKLMRSAGLDIAGKTGFATSMGIEWHLVKTIRWRWLDAIRNDTFRALAGYEVLIVGMKP